MGARWGYLLYRCTDAAMSLWRHHCARGLYLYKHEEPSVAIHDQLINGFWLLPDAHPNHPQNKLQHAQLFYQDHATKSTESTINSMSGLYPLIRGCIYIYKFFKVGRVPVPCTKYHVQVQGTRSLSEEWASTRYLLLYVVRINTLITLLWKTSCCTRMHHLNLHPFFEFWKFIQPQKQILDIRFWYQTGCIHLLIERINFEIIWVQNAVSI